MCKVSAILLLDLLENMEITEFNRLFYVLISFIVEIITTIDIFGSDIIRIGKHHDLISFSDALMNNLRSDLR